MNLFKEKLFCKIITWYKSRTPFAIPENIFKASTSEKDFDFSRSVHKSPCLQYS
jgi:hypothetical protein